VLAVPVNTFTSFNNDDYRRAAVIRKQPVVGHVVQSKGEMRSDLFQGDILMSGASRAAVTSASLLWDRNEVPVQISTSFSKNA
jgi:hypothetical protein